MIEVILKDFLDTHLDVPSFFEFESKMPKKFVIIERTGGTTSDGLKSAVFAIQSYGDTLYEAAVLNEQIKRILIDFKDVPEITGVHLNSDYNFTDTESKMYRYQAVFNINHY